MECIDERESIAIITESGITYSYKELEQKCKDFADNIVSIRKTVFHHIRT